MGATTQNVLAALFVRNPRSPSCSAKAAKLSHVSIAMPPRADPEKWANSLHFDCRRLLE
jgi:hypothetical protein